MAEALVVSSAEAGQKLLQFLARRFDAPASVLHRWIRSGQVRVNGGRAKPFDRVAQGNEIRVPPFAVCSTGAAGGLQQLAGVGEKGTKTGEIVAQGRLALPSIVAETDDLLVFCKPAGLAVHPGTGHTDSLTTRLLAHYSGADFMPTPVHRLDIETSGLLLVAKTYTALRALTDALARHDGSVRKEYLLWVRGDCPWSTPKHLQDRLAKQTDEAGY
ncbi:MAG: RluA family pseudouridine synthase, partial [Bilophila sp.]